MSDASHSSLHWQTNLWVCFFGIISTIIGMTILVPFLPLYIQQLGVTRPEDVAGWSGIAFAASFLAAAFFAPLWGRLGDLYGRKLMLIRASLGMTLAISLLGMAHSVEQLVFIRLLAGILGGYASGAMIFVAAQTPKEKSGWALGIVSTGLMTGSLLGPVIGGYLPQYIGMRATFVMAGGLIFITFLATAFFLKEERGTPIQRGHKQPLPEGWLKHIGVLLLAATLFSFASLSIEPTITLYVQQIQDVRGHTSSHAAAMAGWIVAATSLGSIVSATYLGKLADRIGFKPVLVYGLLLGGLTVLPQAVVNSDWQLLLWRFVMGLCLGGLMPCISGAIRHQVSASHVGTVLGVSVSCQYVGQVLGPVTGGFIGGHFSFGWVLLMTSACMLLGALLVALFYKGQPLVG